MLVVLMESGMEPMNILNYQITNPMVRFCDDVNADLYAKNVDLSIYMLDVSTVKNKMS